MAASILLKKMYSSLSSSSHDRSNDRQDHNHRVMSNPRTVISHPLPGIIHLGSGPSPVLSLDNNHSDAHEYHEVTNVTEQQGLLRSESPTLDFGPSLMDEVFRELDTFITTPEMSSEVSEQQSVLNESASNVKNEIKEIIVSASKQQSTSSSLSSKHKNKLPTVKPISGKDEQTLDDAIKMAKEMASRSSIIDHDNFAFSSDSEASPKTPTSPNKKSGHTLFHFPKFHIHHDKKPRRTFSEEAESIPGVESIISQEAKDAYSSLIENRKPNPIPVPVRSSSIPKDDEADDTSDGNPLRMLRSGQVTATGFSKVKGNKRMSSNSTNKGQPVLSARSSLGIPPPIPTGMPVSGVTSGSQDVTNALPLPPKSQVTGSLMSVPLKHHQRKHPLLIPHNTLTMIDSSSNGSVNHTRNPSAHFIPNNQSEVTNSNRPLPPKDKLPSLSTFRPLGAPPLVKQVSCPEAPSSFSNPSSRRGSAHIVSATNTSNNGSNSSLTTSDGPSSVVSDASAVGISNSNLSAAKVSIAVAVPAPPKPARQPT